MTEDLKKNIVWIEIYIHHMTGKNIRIIYRSQDLPLIHQAFLVAKAWAVRSDIKPKFVS